MVDSDGSPFHPGEQAIQERLGMREKMEMWGHKGIRSYMPDQHREFFAMLPTFFFAVADERGQPWPSVLFGPPGFISSPSETTLQVSALPSSQDPAFSCLKEDVPIGALGIQFHSRRRNRVNGRVSLNGSGQGFEIKVRQTFGNCAQYIQAREPTICSVDPTERRVGPCEVLDHLDSKAISLISKADTFFIASSYQDEDDLSRDGLDMSHRGGVSGFVQIRDGKVLVWPDFKGNFFFNTLGNISKHPQCGLLFIDFERGDTLQLAGTAGVIWDVPAEPGWEMAQRLVAFNVEKAIFLRGSMPFTWKFLGMAPQFAAKGNVSEMAR